MKINKQQQLERDLEIRLKNSKSFTKYTITPNRIREALNTFDKLKFAKDIIRFLHIKQLKNRWEILLKGKYPARYYNFK